MKSPKPFRYWFVLHPDISSPIGGVKQVHRLAEALVHTGRSATIIQDSASFHPGWFTSNVATVSKSDLFKRTDLHPSKDIFILPETYAPRFSTYCPSFPKIIFNQNGSYSFGTNSSKGWFKVSRLLHLYSHPEIKRILTVSEYDSNLLVNGFSIPAERVGLIVNPIGDMPKILPSRKAKSIVYFTRKNQKDVTIVFEIINHSGFANDWSFLPISNLPHSQVLNAFQSSWLYLSFGHPEGFGLPVAEALANGCAVVGYTGLGGRELFKLADQFSHVDAIEPGDWARFVSSTHDFIASHSDHYHKLLSNSSGVAEVIRSKYSYSSFVESVQRNFDQLEKSLSCS